MVDVANQRRMAAKIMKCGLNRVYMPPDKEKLQEISEATTRAAIRSLIVRRYIRKMPERGVSRGRARAAHEARRRGRRRGQGSRRGRASARTDSKTRWITNIREIRRTLRRLRLQKKISTEQYRLYYRMAKGGQFHGRGHLLAQMEARGDLTPIAGKPRKVVREEPLKGKPGGGAALKGKAASEKGGKRAPKEETKKGFLSRGRTKKEE